MIRSPRFPNTHGVHPEPQLALADAAERPHRVLAPLPGGAGVVVVGALVHVHARARRAGLEAVLQHFRITPLSLAVYVKARL